jgi:hypothetical protein
VVTSHEVEVDPPFREGRARRVLGAEDRHEGCWSEGAGQQAVAEMWSLWEVAAS